MDVFEKYICFLFNISELFLCVLRWYFFTLVFQANPNRFKEKNIQNAPTNSRYAIIINSRSYSPEQDE